MVIFIWKNAGGIIDFLANNKSASFEFKKITGQTGNYDTKDVKIMVLLLLEHLNTFWRTLEMPLMNCEINFILTWSANYFIVAGTAVNQIPTFSIIDTKLYVSVLTLSNQNNTKQLTGINIIQN